MTTQTSSVEAEHGRPLRPRSEQAERAIIEATLDLLAESGIGGTSHPRVTLVADGASTVAGPVRAHGLILQIGLVDGGDR